MNARPRGIADPSCRYRIEKCLPGVVYFNCPRFSRAHRCALGDAHEAEDSLFVHANEVNPFSFWVDAPHRAPKTWETTIPTAKV